VDPHAALYMRRSRASSSEQKSLALEEHKAFAREWTRESPLLAPVSLAAAIPLYTLAKTLGIVKSRTSGSMSEIVSGYQGIYEGLTTK
jgi:hypothetical protein